jgi:putative MATE family efflux protein
MTLDKNRSELRRIWAIAWPASISMFLFTVLNLIDMKWIGFLGTGPVAAVSLCGNIISVIFGLTGILYTGTLALIARFIGARDNASSANSLAHSLLLGGLLGVILAVGGWLGTPALIGFFQLEPQVYQDAVIYMRLIFIFFMVISCSTPLWSAFMAAGDTRTPLMLSVVVVLMNAVLDPVFIFDRGRMLVGFFGWEVMGAALATLVSETIGTGLLFALMFTRRFPAARPRLSRIQAGELWRILKIGIPASIAMISRPLSTVLLQKILAMFGSGPLAGFGIGLRWIGLNWIFFGGMGIAVSALTGQYLGSKEPERADKMVRKGLLIGLLFQFVSTFIYLVYAPELVAFMEHSSETVEPGAAFMRWVSVSFFFSSLGGIAGAAMAGAGDTRPIMVISVLANWILKLPLAWALALPFGMGVDGIWQAMFYSLVFEGTAMLYWYRKGNWKTKKV